MTISDNSHLYTIGDFNHDGKDDFIRIPDKETYSGNDKWELFLNENETNFTKVSGESGFTHSTD